LNQYYDNTTIKEVIKDIQDSTEQKMITDTLQAGDLEMEVREFQKRNPPDICIKIGIAILKIHGVSPVMENTRRGIVQIDPALKGLIRP
jgi:hypothetical protein